MPAMLISLLIALLIFISLREIGNRVHGLLGWMDSCMALDLCMGIACMHIIFFGMSAFLSPAMVQPMLLVIHVLMNVSAWTHRSFLKDLTLKGHVNFTLFILVLLCPLILRTLSPCVNSDSLLVYLPNVEWVVHRGLDFNPFQTAYTTMPMGVEYLFSQAHAWGGATAVRILDALFGISLLAMVHKQVSSKWSVPGAWMLVTFMMLIPGSYRYLFGNGKVDMVSSFVVLTGVMYLPVHIRSDLKTICRPLLIFSLACAMKYTNWILLCLPILSLLWSLLHSAGGIRKWLVLLIPMLFTFPVLIRNLVLTGNPLAPLLHDPDQFEYIETHGRIPAGPLEALMAGWTMDAAWPVRIAAITHDLLPFTLFGIVFFFILKYWIRSGHSLWSQPHAEWLFLSLLPWYGFLSFSVQPARFLMPQLTVAALLCIQLILGKSTASMHQVSDLTGRISKLVTGGFMLLFVWMVEGHWLGDYIRSQRISVQRWYEEMGEGHSAATIAMVGSPDFKSKPLLCTDRPVMSHVPFHYWDRLPTDLDLKRQQSGIVIFPSGSFLNFCRGQSCSSDSIHAQRTIYASGEWRLMIIDVKMQGRHHD